MIRPLVSFCIKSYNHSAYVRDALRGALSQTYRPLEIVISDDKSSDDTWQQITEIVSEYISSGGDISFVLNRNTLNLGNFGNWVRVLELAHGELCVKADGDDISYPERTEKIVNAWIASGKSATVISHSAYTIDKNGKKIGIISSASATTPCGAVMAWRRDCLTAFNNDFNGNAFYDDDIYARRALMLGGGEIVLKDILGEYRIGSGISTSLYDLKQSQRSCYHKVVDGVGFSLQELATNKLHMSEERYEDLRQLFISQRENARVHLELIEGTAFTTRYKAFKLIGHASLFSPVFFQDICFLISGRIGDNLLFLYCFLNYWRRRAVYA